MCHAASATTSSSVTNSRTDYSPVTICLTRMVPSHEARLMGAARSADEENLPIFSKASSNTMLLVELLCSAIYLSSLLNVLYIVCTSGWFASSIHTEANIERGRLRGSPDSHAPGCTIPCHPSRIIVATQQETMGLSAIGLTSKSPAKLLHASEPLQCYNVIHRIFYTTRLNE